MITKVERDGVVWQRRISFTTAYDYRREKPNRGQHPMHIAFVLSREDKGALVFDVNTSWYIDRKQTPSHPYSYGLVAHRYIDHDPHSESIMDSCDWLHGDPCVAESLCGSTAPLLDELLDLLVTEGEDPLWERLEQIYKERM